MEPVDKYIGWAIYISAGENQVRLETCDSDAPGAFKIFRQSALDEAYSTGYRHGRKDGISDARTAIGEGIAPFYDHEETDFTSDEVHRSILSKVDKLSA